VAKDMYDFMTMRVKGTISHPFALCASYHSRVVKQDNILDIGGHSLL
jgi:hypothetical protein